MKKVVIITLLFLFCSSAFANRKDCLADYAGGLAAWEKHEIVFKDNSISKKDSKNKFSIEAFYPAIEGETGFNQVVKSRLEKAVDGFSKDAIDWHKTADNVPKEFSSSMEICYLDISSTKDRVSLLFEVFYYFAGAAHPSSNFFTINYDLVSKKLIEFPLDLKKASKFSIRTLKDSLGEDLLPEMVEEGAAPTPMNFKNFAITSKGVAIFFNESQVGPHAIGPQMVIYPNSLLKYSARHCQ